MGFNWGSFFSTAVDELGTAAKTKDSEVKAEAKATAEAFAEKQSEYEDEVTKNRRLLTTEVGNISDLVGQDVGKIRTIMRTYGNTDVLTKLQSDYVKYQTDAMRINKSTDPSLIKFKSLKEYINGRLTSSGTALKSKAAVESEIIESEVNEGTSTNQTDDMQEAQKEAKKQGVDLTTYLQNQAMKMSDRPSFNIDAKAARLVEESKMGIFGKTLTLKQAKEKILAMQGMEGAGIGSEAKDLGETGFALAREGGVGGDVITKLNTQFKTDRENAGDEFSAGDKEAIRNNIVKGLDSKFRTETNKLGEFTQVTTEPAYKAAITLINNRLSDKVDGKFTLDRKSRKIYESIKRDYERQLGILTGKDGDGETDDSKKKTTADAIIEVRKNPKLLEQFIKKFPKYKLPPDLQKQADELKEKNINKNKADEKRVINLEGNAPSRNNIVKGFGLNVTDDERQKLKEWDALYGQDFNPNGTPKAK